MGTIRRSPPVKLFAGILVADRQLLPEVEERLAAAFGAIDYRSPVIPFDFTDYYENQMGDVLDRVFYAFDRLIDPVDLATIKQRTNDWETELKPRFPAVPRPVNIDPGYLESSKVVLASTKNFYHRIVIGEGIFAEVTMHFRNNTFQYFPWTYPDYQSKDYQDFFIRLRQIYRSQLKAMCITNRED